MTEASQSNGRNAGTALVIVLGMLTLVSVIVVAFVTSVSTELKSSKSYASESGARSLADSAVNIVISQIQEATSNSRLAWASQPGMVRTYDDAGDAVAAYKLYSSAQMLVNGGFNANSSLPDEVPANWSAASMRNQYTDLNAPVTTPDGTSHYPILDPRAVAVSQAQADRAVSGNETPIQGCYLNSEAAGITAVSSSQPNPLPMPVRWLYVLKDGSITSLSSDGKILPAGMATAKNPIVGRIAFWTDDETAKVNINTAAEGTFWDRPWAGPQPPGPATRTDTEGLLASRIPAQNEFQRFPGHPAMTCLSVIFPPRTGENLADYNERIYGIVPRISGGGTKSGTTSVDPTGTDGLSLDSDRLYGSVDELLFRPSAAPRAKNSVDAADALSVDDVERARFFLTATSRAPEVNQFNKPRISLWPLQANTSAVGSPKLATLRNAKDKLIAFCSTMGNKPLYFQRFNDFNAPARTAGSAYLAQTQDPIPSSQSKDMDWFLSSTGAAPIGGSRNQELYRYLQFLTDQSIPGLGGRLAAKYGNGRDQILTEMMDYIRSCVNTRNRTTLLPQYSYAPGGGQVVPLVLPNGTKGFGRFPTVTNAAIVFYAASTTDPKQMGAVLILQPFSPTPGAPSWDQNVRYVITGLENFDIDGQTNRFPAQAVNLVTGREGYSGESRQLTALTGMLNCFSYFASPTSDNYKTLGPTEVGKNSEERNYPFYMPPIAVAGPNFKFKGATITVKIYAAYNKSLEEEDLIQTIRIPFPASEVTLPLPTVPAPVTGDTQPASKYTNFNDRKKLGAGSVPRLIQNGDVVRGVEADPNGPAKGDLRIHAALREVPESYFKEHPSYHTANRMAHSLRVYRTPLTGYSGTKGKLVAVNYPSVSLPVVPGQLAGALMSNGAPGDWDNGVGAQADGPYINKGDEGNLAVTSSHDGGPYYTFGQFANETGASFSPNRQISSAVMFGSLSTGVFGQTGAPAPWQTLLFCRHPLAGDEHPGFADESRNYPADHAFLDLFTMPIVEPYAISEPFSTAGKVNMNYQIVPFTYLTRSTGVRAVLKSTKIMAIPASDAASYKSAAREYRYELNLDERSGTLAGFEKRFETGEIFKTASEICDISLVPQGAGNPTYEKMEDWWKNYTLTGDNVREFPYGHIYPRLTTKSNTFTVHVKAQVLKKAPITPQDQFIEGRDQVAGEFRGSFVAERFLDPNADALVTVDGTQTEDLLHPTAMVGPYKFRVLTANRFEP